MVGISAVIPCCNVKHEYIACVLDSVLAQTFQNYEVILVDDGSQEPYREILVDAVKKDPRIRLVTQEHKGVSAARNLGAEKATGKYIVFIDADDYVFPWHFQEAYLVAEDKEADIVYAYECCGRSADISVDHTAAPRVVERDEHWLASNFIGASSYLDQERYFGRASYSRIVRREVALQTKFQEDVAIGEDILWNLALLKTAKKRYIVESAWYVYIIREDSVTQKFNPDMNSVLQPFYHKLEVYVKNDDSLWQDYLHLIKNDLEKLIIGCWLGHPDNQDSVLEKQRVFDHICNQHPWNLLQERSLCAALPAPRCLLGAEGGSADEMHP